MDTLFLMDGQKKSKCCMDRKKIGEQLDGQKKIYEKIYGWIPHT